jgi:hypothetical protein
MEGPIEGKSKAVGWVLRLGSLVRKQPGCSAQDDEGFGYWRWRRYNT